MRISKRLDDLEHATKPQGGRCVLYRHDGNLYTANPFISDAQALDPDTVREKRQAASDVIMIEFENDWRWRQP